MSESKYSSERHSSHQRRMLKDTFKDLCYGYFGFRFNEVLTNTFHSRFPKALSQGLPKGFAPYLGVPCQAPLTTQLFIQSRLYRTLYSKDRDGVNAYRHYLTNFSKPEEVGMYPDANGGSESAITDLNARYMDRTQVSKPVSPPVSPLVVAGNQFVAGVVSGQLGTFFGMVRKAGTMAQSENPEHIYKAYTRLYSTGPAYRRHAADGLLFGIMFGTFFYQKQAFGIGVGNRGMHDRAQELFDLEQDIASQGDESSISRASSLSGWRGIWNTVQPLHTLGAATNAVLLSYVVTAPLYHAMGRSFDLMNSSADIKEASVVDVVPEGVPESSRGSASSKVLQKGVEAHQGKHFRAGIIPNSPGGGISFAEWKAAFADGTFAVRRMAYTQSMRVMIPALALTFWNVASDYLDGHFYDVPE